MFVFVDVDVLGIVLYFIIEMCVIEVCLLVIVVMIVCDEIIFWCGGYVMCVCIEVMIDLCCLIVLLIKRVLMYIMSYLYILRCFVLINV